MRNTLAIAQREMNAYFASPIAYVLIGFFALLFGWFFYVPLAYFAEQSGQAGMNPTQALNMNQMLVGPTLMNTTVIMLFLFPLITMRTYSEEKRSGTIELLLTSPITDRFDDFSKGVIDLKHVVYYLSFISFGLFLTAKSVDSERWRG